MKTYLAIDQYGNKLLLDGTHPRKALLNHHNVTKATKIYRDTKEGKPKHIGYLVAGFWYTLYKLTPFEGNHEPTANNR